LSVASGRFARGTVMVSSGFWLPASQEGLQRSTMFIALHY